MFFLAHQQNNKLHINGTGVDVENLPTDVSKTSTDPFIGFSRRTTVMNTATVSSDGTTVVNVYYDRIKYKLKFFFARRQLNNRGEETGNYLVPVLTGNNYNPPSGQNQQTWQAYATQGSGMTWTDSQRADFSRICTYSSNVTYEDYNSYRYWYYYI